MIVLWEVEQQQKMCMENNRNYIGSEISKEYCEIIQKRLEPLKVWDKFGG